MAVRDGKINLSHISGCFEPNPLVKPGQWGRANSGIGMALLGVPYVYVRTYVY